MQTDLRLLLLIVSIVLGAFIVFKAFRDRRDKAPPMTRQAFEKSILQNTHQAMSKAIPDLQLGDSDPLLEDYGSKYIEIDTSIPPSAEIIDEKLPVREPAKGSIRREIVTLALIPRDSKAFSGEALLTVFEDENFRYGKMNLFHCHENNDPEQSILYSIASLVEPGIFNFNEMPYGSFPGILLWMVVQDGSGADLFEAMLHDAKHLAGRLNGTVCDEKRQQLTVQAISNIRLRIRDPQSIAI